MISSWPVRCTCLKYSSALALKADFETDRDVAYDDPPPIEQTSPETPEALRRSHRALSRERSRTPLPGR